MRSVITGKPREAAARFAPAIVVDAGPLMFTSGLVARDADGAIVARDNMFAQARQIFSDLNDLLGEVGCTPHDLVKLTYYVTDMTRWEEVAQARRAFLGDAAFPASTTVEVVRLWDAGCMIEVDAVARIRAG